MYKICILWDIFHWISWYLMFVEDKLIFLYFHYNYTTEPWRLQLQRCPLWSLVVVLQYQSLPLLSTFYLTTCNTVTLSHLCNGQYSIVNTTGLSSPATLASHSLQHVISADQRKYNLYIKYQLPTTIYFQHLFPSNESNFKSTFKQNIEFQSFPSIENNINIFLPFISMQIKIFRVWSWFFGFLSFFRSFL